MVRYFLISGYCLFAVAFMRYFRWAVAN